MGKLKKVLIMAGGTGGHVFPGLAVAKQLRELGVEVHWLGTKQGFEAKVVTEAGFPLHCISISGLRGKGLKAAFLMPYRLLLAIAQSLRIIQHLQPDVVLGMGGFVSGPGGLATWLLRKPLIVHEQNAKMGLTNKCLAHLAVRVLEGFPGTFPQQAKVIATGNPVRAEIAQILPPLDRLDKHTVPMRLLVVGGSLGAAAINNLVPKALAKLSAPLEVYHQTGEKHFEEAVKAYQAAGVVAKVVPFIKDMEQAYVWADIVVCRAGALTIAELCVAGLGSILIPYPYAVDDHQTANANYLVKHHAAILVQQAALTEDDLAAILTELAASPERRVAMAEAAYALRKADATDNVLRICEEVCR